MKIAVVGAGGVGGYFGGLLAKHGHDVHLIARGENLKAIQKSGLYINSPNGDFHVSNINATDKPSTIGTVDTVIVAVKGWQLEEVTSAVESLTASNTLVLPLLNGVEAADTLNKQLKTGIVLNGLCGIIAKIDAPGKINHIAIDPFVKFGPTNKPAELSELTTVFNDIGIDAEVPDDIARASWMKFLFIAPLSGITSITRSTMDVVRELPETRGLLTDAITEALSVGQARGIKLGKEDIHTTMAMIDKAPAGGTTSMQRDIQGGFPSELDTQTGAIVRLGRQSNIATPVNTFIYNALLPQENSARNP